MKGKSLVRFVGSLVAVAVLGVTLAGAASADGGERELQTADDNVARFELEKVSIVSIDVHGSGDDTIPDTGDSKVENQASLVGFIPQPEPPLDYVGGIALHDTGDDVRPAEFLVGATDGSVRFTPYSACYSNYVVCDLKSYECEHLGVGCPPPSSRPW